MKLIEMAVTTGSITASSPCPDAIMVQTSHLGKDEEEESDDEEKEEIRETGGDTGTRSVEESIHTRDR